MKIKSWLLTLLISSLRQNLWKQYNQGMNIRQCSLEVHLTTLNLYSLQILLYLHSLELDLHSLELYLHSIQLCLKQCSKEQYHYHPQYLTNQDQLLQLQLVTLLLGEEWVNINRSVSTSCQEIANMVSLARLVVTALACTLKGAHST